MADADAGHLSDRRSPRPGQPSSDEALRLFCIPYAGAQALIYRGWSNLVPATVDVSAIELPGHGARMREPLAGSLSALVSEIESVCVRSLSRPFAIFGHSLGALLAYEVSHRLRERHGVEPTHLFVSGRRAPHFAESQRQLYDLPEGELIEELRHLNGTPSEVLENEELMRLMIPILRSDLAMCQTYVYPGYQPLTCPITAFGGLADPNVSQENLDGWKSHTVGAFSSELFHGDHFFLHTSTARLLQILSRKLIASTRQ